jgi:arylsulfatase A-like enzyme
LDRGEEAMSRRRHRATATGPPRRAVAAAALLCAGAVAAASLLSAPAAAGKRPKGDERPNVVVVMSDDQTADSMRYMAQTREQLGGQGATFANSFASFPLCCPSRATFLTGQYPHNHGVLSNDEDEEGGYLSLDSSNTLAVWLQRAGYYTAHIGKYLNGYEQVPNTIPPGWTEWHGSTRTYQFYGYQLNEQGTLVNFGSTADQYSSDVYTQKAIDLIRARAPEKQPFFLSLAYLAPHGGGPNPSPQPPDDCESTAKPAPRHANAFDSEPLPQPPSFNEADVSDKPAAIQGRAPLTENQIANIEREYRCRIESLLAVDEGVARVIQALRDTGEFEDTLFVYTSDNGFFHGEHRVPMGKTRVYEPSIRVPLIIHGPGIPDGVTTEDLAMNTDLAPTIVELTGAEPGRAMDGLSLLPPMESPGLRRGRAILIETRSYTAVRTARYVYVENATGELELYDLDNDPDQLQSLHADPTFDQVEASLASMLAALRTCSGSGCRGTPALDLKLRFKDGEPGRGECAKGAVRAILKGADAGKLTAAGYSVGSKQLGGDDAAPFKVRIPGGKLKRRGRSNVIASVTLIDGREQTIDERVKRC